MHFSKDETQALNTRIRRLERETGIELVAAVVDKCDHYPEIPWKAFALGTVLGALAVFIAAAVRPDWDTAYGTLWNVVVTIGVGALAALLTAFWPAWARVFLDRARAEGEIRQHAQSLFLEHEIFTVPQRTGMLVLIGLFEHQVVALPDIGLVDRLPEGGLQTAIDAMTPLLKQGKPMEAILQGVEELQRSLATAGFRPSNDATDRIAETVIQQKGGGHD